MRNRRCGWGWKSVFPTLWVPSGENREVRQLLWHRHRLVQMRTRIKNQLPSIALREGAGRQHRLWSKEGGAQLEWFDAGALDGAAARQSVCGWLDQ